MPVTRSNWQRNKDGLGVWEHRGKVAVAGWGQSPIDRRWDGVSPDKTMGAYTMIAIQHALKDAGLTIDDVDGLLTSPDTRVGQTWAPRPFLDPPYDSEDGITLCSGEWIQKQMGFKNVKYIESNSQAMAGLMGHAAQAVGEGEAEVCVVWYPMGNIEGRYEQGATNVNSGMYTRGNAAFNAAWGYQSGAQMNALMVFEQYCRKYNYPIDGGLAPFAVNQRRNGLMTPWGFYAQHEPYQITVEDYINSRYESEPLRILDCDRPVMGVAAFVFTTAARAKDMRQKPVYILNHATASDPARSTMATLEEHQESGRRLGIRMYEGAGLSAADVDVFNPYDGYLTFTQQFLEGFQWHGVKEGEAMDFYKGDIRVEGPHPYLSSGGNNGTGRTRSAIMSDCIEQLRGQAGGMGDGVQDPSNPNPGPRQIQIRHETALMGALTPGGATFLMFGTDPMTS